MCSELQERFNLTRNYSSIQFAHENDNGGGHLWTEFHFSMITVNLSASSEPRRESTPLLIV